MFRNGLAVAPLFAAIIAAALVAAAPQIFNDGDTFMHIAAGQRMLQLGAVLHTDPFSFTFAGKPWETHEWLSEVVMGLCYNLAGLSGVALLMAAAFGATAGLLARHLGRWLSGPALIATLLLGLLSLSPSILARPHLLALPFLEMWLAELLTARSQARLPDWRRLAPLMVVWANLHGSFAFGLALLGAFGLEALIHARGSRAVLLRWAGLGLVCGLAAMVSPHGLNNLLFPLRLMSMKVLPWINEWQPMTPATQPTFTLPLLIGAFALIRTRAQVALLPLLLTLLLVWLALGQVRQVLLFGVCVPLLLAEPLGRALTPKPASKSVPLWAGGLIGLAAVLVIAGVRLAVPARVHDGPTTPVVAISHLPPALRGAPVLNTYDFGSYLLFVGDPPYIDSRAEVYGDPFLARYGRLSAGDPEVVASTLADPRIRWTLLDANSPIVGILDHTPGWTRYYADPLAVIHVRTTAATPSEEPRPPPPLACPGSCPRPSRRS